MKNILVIAPHPDDEAIGCGGALLRHAAHGDSTRVIFLTSGEKGCRGKQEEETSRIREQEAAAAAKILRLQTQAFWRLPDGGVAADSDTVQRLHSSINDCMPRVIYVTHPGEMHSDHIAAARIVAEAVRNYPGHPPEVRTYEVWTPLQDIAHVEDITPYVRQKRQAIQAHRSQCSIMRFDEATLALNRYRGEMHSWPGGPYAEVFGTLPQ